MKEKVCEGLELDFDEIENINLHSLGECAVFVYYKHGYIQEFSKHKVALAILDWWHKKRYENLYEQLDSIVNSSQKEFNNFLAKKILVSQELDKYRKLHKDADESCKYYQEENEKLKESNILLSNIQLSAQVQSDEAKEYRQRYNFAYMECIKLVNEKNRLAEEIFSLTQKLAAPTQMWVKNPEDAKEIKRLKKKVNRLISRSKYTVTCSFGEYAGNSAVDFEEMRAEYQECWNKLKEYQEYVHNQLPGKHYMFYLVDCFKPSAKFIKE